MSRLHAVIMGKCLHLPQQQVRQQEQNFYYKVLEEVIFWSDAIFPHYAHIFWEILVRLAIFICFTRVHQIVCMSMPKELLTTFFLTYIVHYASI